MSSDVTSISNATLTATYAANAAARISADTSATPSSTASNSLPVFSSKLVVDPVAGAITEFLDGNGNIQSQFPSSSVVAYLRAGLTSDGFPKSATSASTTTQSA